MTIHNRNRGLTCAVVRNGVLLLMGFAATGDTLFAAADEESSEPASVSTHMSEDLRASIRSVIVVAGAAPTEKAITGTYDDVTPGLVGGISEGANMGTQSVQIAGVAINLPLSILTIPGAVYGGLSGQAKRDTQELRDAMTEDLAQAENRSLNHDGLAQDVFWGLQKVPDLNSKTLSATTPIPDDADTVAYVSVVNVNIDLDDDEAILTTTAEVTLIRHSDQTRLYKRLIQYQDRDTLSKWTERNNALWRDYANFAGHYLGREISAEMFETIDLRHELLPVETDTIDLKKKDVWQGSSKSAAPTFAWELKLLDGNPYGSWADAIDESDIYYDIEIYDAHRLVYAQRQIPDAHFTVAGGVPDCKTYRWSVRPSYHIGDDIKYGQWMRSRSLAETTSTNGVFGREASEAPAYTQDFALLKIACGKK
jgi:hypothetical protein